MFLGKEADFIDLTDGLATLLEIVEAAVDAPVPPPLSRENTFRRFQLSSTTEIQGKYNEAIRF